MVGSLDSDYSFVEEAAVSQDSSSVMHGCLVCQDSHVDQNFRHQKVYYLTVIEHHRYEVLRPRKVLLLDPGADSFENLDHSMVLSKGRLAPVTMVES